MSSESLNKTALAQGYRIRYLRDKVAKVNLVNFAEKAEVNKNTLSTWETGELVNPILAKNIEKLIKAFSHYGVNVSERWLRAGEGDLPKFDGKTITFDNSFMFIPANPLKEDSYTQHNFDSAPIILTQNFLEELKAFTLVKNAIVTKVEHHGFLPVLEKGDWVGGIWQDSSILLEPRLCIVEIRPDIPHVAILTPTQQEKYFDINYLNNSINLLAKGEKTSMSFDRIAPVIRFWH